MLQAFKMILFRLGHLVLQLHIILNLAVHYISILYALKKQSPQTYMKGKTINSLETKKFGLLINTVCMLVVNYQTDGNLKY